MTKKTPVIHDNTPVNLTADQINQIDSEIKKLVNQMLFFKERISSPIDKATVNTHLSLLEYTLRDLSDLTGYTSIKTDKLKHEGDEIRAKNVRIFELESQLGKGVNANAVEGALRRYEYIARGWYEAFGFHYASISYTSYGLILDLSSELAYFDKEHLSEKDFYEACIKHLTPLQKLDGISIYNEPGSSRQDLLDTDVNKQLLVNQIQKEFPNYRLYKFTSSKDCDQLLLSVKLLLTYQDLEAFESRMMTLNSTRSK